MSAEAVTRLRDLRELLCGGSALAAAEGRALVDGIDRWLAGEVELDEAFGFERGAGKRRASTQAILDERDRLLREAAAAFLADFKPGERPRELHQRWLRYAAVGWPRERALAEAPARRLGTLEGLLWQVLKTKDTLIAERSLRRILATNPPVFVATAAGDIEETDEG